jgi:hypothetical protein
MGPRPRPLRRPRNLWRPPHPEGKQRFWESKVTFDIVGRLFVPIKPVNVAAAWNDLLWRRHLLTICVAEVAFSVCLNIGRSANDFSDRKSNELIFGHIRRASDERFRDRWGLDRVTMGDDVL